MPLTRRQFRANLAGLGGDSKPAGQRPNREHGADYPSGAKAVTAPATVSGEAICEVPLGLSPGKAQVSPETRESGDLPPRRDLFPINAGHHGG
jgi:hypothetical protein